MAGNFSKYRFIHDPGHGWLEVSLHELAELNLVDKISGSSYVSPDRQLVYLEEDCDAYQFMVAKIGSPYKGCEQEWKDWREANEFSEYQENTFVRNLDHYQLLEAPHLIPPCSLARA